MYFTIVNNNNDIIRVAKLSKYLVREAEDTESDDPETTPLETLINEFLVVELGEGETAHVGRFEGRFYTFDGTEFTEKDEPDYQPPELRGFREILMLITQQLKDAGYFLPLHKDLIQTKSDAKELIDQAASQACERFVSRGKFTVIEYQFVEQEVKQWRADGSLIENVPEMLQSWFDTGGFSTVEETALNIEQAAINFRTIIQSTRRIRLQAKKSVDDATVEDYKSVAEGYINQLGDI
jgi:phage repressor protein C with HTH and peptisase S24 domain